MKRPSLVNAVALLASLALAPRIEGWDAAAGYAFDRGLCLDFKLSLQTEIHYDLDRIERFLPVRSSYSLRFLVLDRAASGEAVLAVVSRLDEAVPPGDGDGPDRAPKDRVRYVQDWVSSLAKTDAAALVLDPQGNILRGRLPWPEATCFQIQLALAGISLRKRSWDWNVGGRFQIENVFRGLEAAGGAERAVFTSGNSFMQARLLVDTRRALPALYEAKYGYQSFQAVFAQTLKLELMDARPGVGLEEACQDADMLSAVLQAVALGGLEAPPAPLVARAISSPRPDLRLAAAALAATRGIPAGAEIAALLGDESEIVRFNVAKAMFRCRDDRSALEAFLDDGAPELRVRAGRLLEARPAEDADAELIRALKDGIVPDARSEAAVYGAARAWLRRGRERPFAQIGPSEFGLASGLTGRKMYHVAVHCPADYDPSEDWPVLINLSGGNGFAESSFLGLKGLVPAHYILVEPDAGYGNWWDPDQLRMFDDLLRRLARDYALDPDRVYLQGFSNGGVGTYRFASLHPDRFAAVAALEGYSKPPGERQDVETEMMLNLQATPVLIIHGERDPVISIEPDRILSEYLRRHGIPFRFLPVSGAGHTISFQSHKDDILSFFRKYRRDPAPAKLRLVMDDASEGRAFWVRIDGKADPAQRASVEAELKKGRIVVRTRNVARLSLLLNDLHYGAEPVEVVLDKKTVFRGALRLDPATLAESLRAGPDYARLYGVKLTFDIKTP
jgi:poly(3-hydroxybutyrate) depolymerase